MGKDVLQDVSAGWRFALANDGHDAGAMVFMQKRPGRFQAKLTPAIHIDTWPRSKALLRPLAARDRGPEGRRI